MNVWFIDTSVLDHIVPVPGWSKAGSPDRQDIALLMGERVDSGDSMILPITAVIETGNHICQVPEGGRRRSAAMRFAEILRWVLNGRSPWVLDEVQWDRNFLKDFVAGASTGTTWVDLASQGKNGLGGGDLTLVVERDQYCAQTGIPRERVRIWTLDRGLSAYA